MNQLATNKKQYLSGVLELAFRQLELSEFQYEQVKKRYEVVAQWIGSSSDLRLNGSIIYPQGSVLLRTTVAPISNGTFDLDFVCQLPAAANDESAVTLHKLVGDRLRENGTYKTMLEPKNRCWRLNYAESSRFHMDITLAVRNLACGNNGILVPDRELAQLKPSNPKGFAAWVDEVSKLSPTFTQITRRMVEAASAKADIQPLPENVDVHDSLRRIIQVAKRHRDFTHHSGKLEHPPISVIITTLATHSYAYCVRAGSYETPWDFVLAVLRNMHRFVRVMNTSNGPWYLIENPATTATTVENFAEKWNEVPEKANAFFKWHAAIVREFEQLLLLEGSDQVQHHFAKQLVGPEADSIFSSINASVNAARVSGRLLAGRTGVSIATGTPVRKNTFFGD